MADGFLPVRTIGRSWARAVSQRLTGQVAWVCLGLESLACSHFYRRGKERHRQNGRVAAEGLGGQMEALP